jgi:long-chain fatty acid transport protein
MARLRGIQHTAGVQLVSPNTRFTSPTGVKTENDIGGPVGLPPPGQFFLTANLQDLNVPWFGDAVIGIGLESLFGFANKYPKDGPFASSITKAQLPLLDIKPTIAYPLNEYIAIGLGADIFTFASFLGEGHAERQFISAGMGAPPGTQLELNGTGTTAGLNASLLLTMLRNPEGKPLFNVGFVWRSQAVLPLKGELRANGARVAKASTTQLFPEMYQWGIAGWPIRNQKHEWKIEIDVDLVRWQSIRNFDTHLSNGVTVSNPQHWSNAVTIAVGTEFKWLKPEPFPYWEFAVRTGYNHSETLVPDQNFDPAFPDADVNGVFVGMGMLCRGAGKWLGLMECGSIGGDHTLRKTLGMDLAYGLLLWEPRTITGNFNPTVDGRYKTTTHAGSITFTVDF